MAAGQQWFLVLNGQQAGPFAQEDVLGRLRAGQIDRATLGDRFYHHLGGDIPSQGE